MLAEGSTNAERIELAYRLAFAREPSKEEVALAERFLASPRSEKDALTPWEQYAQALLASNEFLHVD